MSTQIKYKGNVVASFEKGTVTLDTTGHKFNGNVEVVSDGDTSECNKGHIIDVTELPTENIDDNAIYCVEEFCDIIILTESDSIPLSLQKVFSSIGTPVSIIIHKAFNINDITNPYFAFNSENLEAGCEYLHVYYIENGQYITTYQENGQWEDPTPIKIIYDIQEIEAATQTNRLYLLKKKKYYQHHKKEFVDFISREKFLNKDSDITGRLLLPNLITYVDEFPESCNYTQLFIKTDENNHLQAQMWQNGEAEKFEGEVEVSIIYNRYEAIDNTKNYLLLNEWTETQPLTETVSYITNNGVTNVSLSKWAIVNVEQDKNDAAMAVIGYWEWNDSLYSNYEIYTEEVSFVHDGVSYSRIQWGGDAFYLYFDDTNVYDVHGWVDGVSRIIDFGKEPKLVSKRFGNFLKTYARQLPFSEERIIVPSKEQQIVQPINTHYLSKVTVEPIPDSYTEPSGTLEITTEGPHDVTNYQSVNVQIIREIGQFYINNEDTGINFSSKFYIDQSWEEFIEVNDYLLGGLVREENIDGQHLVYLYNYPILYTNMEKVKVEDKILNNYQYNLQI